MLVQRTNRIAQAQIMRKIKESLSLALSGKAIRRNSLSKPNTKKISSHSHNQKLRKSRFQELSEQE
jgi:hypothetical protein